MASSNSARREGLVIGLIAYLSVAAFYMGFDLLATRGSFFTVDLLGKAVFQGLRDPSVLQYPIALDTTAILQYNALHFVVSLLIGLTVMQLVTHAERHPRHARAVLAVMVAGLVLTIFVVGFLTEPIRSSLPWWSIVSANLCSTLLAAFWLMRRRSGLWPLFFASGRPGTV